ncbi:hypothetical protein Tco_1525937 [Tanacetum coccineum]
MATPIDFSNFAMNRLEIDKLTQEVLLGPVYNLLKGTCQSSIKLEYNMEECYTALIDRLDWENPEEYFFNNDLEYLKLGSEERKYTTSITKTKATKYDLKFIEDMIPNQWSPIKVGYNKDVAFGINPERGGDFPHLHLNDIEDMLLLQVQHKLFNLEGSDIVDLAVALRMFTRRIIIQKHVEDVQLGVESYQKKLNLTKPQKDFPTISTKEPYTPSFDPPGVVYEDSSNQKRLMRADELYKFSDGTLTLVRDKLHYMVLNFRMGYNKGMPRRKWSSTDQRRSKIIVEVINELLWERRVMRNLERLVGARELEMNYRLMQRTVVEVRYSSYKNWRDLPRDTPLDRIEVLRYDTKGVKVRMRRMQTKRELTLEQTQQGVSDDVLVNIKAVEE